MMSPPIPAIRQDDRSRAEVGRARRGFFESLIGELLIDGGGNHSGELRVLKKNGIGPRRVAAYPPVGVVGAIVDIGIVLSLHEQFFLGCLVGAADGRQENGGQGQRNGEDPAEHAFATISALMRPMQKQVGRRSRTKKKGALRALQQGGGGGVPELLQDTCQLPPRGRR